MRSAIENALRITADDGGTWEAGRDVFWKELQDDTPLGLALDRALRRTSGDSERLRKAKKAFWDTFRPSITHRGVAR